MKIIELDKRICDVEENSENEQTFREYIRESEKTFGLDKKDIDSMNQKTLNSYLEWIDYLWEK